MRRRPTKSASDSDLREFGNLKGGELGADRVKTLADSLHQKCEEQSRNTDVKTKGFQDETESEEDLHRAHSFGTVAKYYRHQLGPCASHGRADPDGRLHDRGQWRDHHRCLIQVGSQ